MHDLREMIENLFDRRKNLLKMHIPASMNVSKRDW